MEEISFNDTFTLGKVVNENTVFRHIHYPQMLSRYDSNLIEFKQYPSLSEFKKVEAYLKDFQIKKGLDYLKFSFPANIELTSELGAYLKDQAYGKSFIELYAIEPSRFPVVKRNLAIDVQKVTQENLETLVEMKYRNDLEFGHDFASEKKDLTRRQFDHPSIQQVLAFYHGKPAGYVDLIVSQNTVEIDDLTVEPIFQRKGIGSLIQGFVMDTYPNHTVILIADGEDTPREMYRKQNYQYRGFKYEILQLF